MDGIDFLMQNQSGEIGSYGTCNNHVFECDLTKPNVLRAVVTFVLLSGVLFSAFLSLAYLASKKETLTNIYDPQKTPEVNTSLPVTNYISYPCTLCWETECN